jgi:type IV secretion system protein VirB10
MRKLPVLVSALALSASSAIAQSQSAPAQTPTQSSAQSNTQSVSQAELAPQIVTVPSGTKVLLMLKNSVSSRNAKPGDGVFLESTFPVVENGRVVIPAGTFVQGVVDSVKRSGRVKGRAELLLHFTTLVYPNGYTVTMPGSLESSDSSDSQKVKDKEGTVRADGNKGRDAGTIATTTGTGVLIGGLSRGVKGGLIGGGIGAAVGVATAMLTRGDEVRIESGSSVEMVLQRPLDLDVSRIDTTNRYVSNTPQRYRILDKPSSSTPQASPIPGVGIPR